MSTTNPSRPPTATASRETTRQRQPLRRRRRFPIGRGPDADQALIDRCLDGEEKAWEQLYLQFHSRLVEAIKFLLGTEGQKVHLVDEIAARVWYALLRDDAKLLARFDVARNCRLDAFLMGIARMEILRYFRSERRPSPTPSWSPCSTSSSPRSPTASGNSWKSTSSPCRPRTRRS